MLKEMARGKLKQESTNVGSMQEGTIKKICVSKTQIWKAKKTN
jgi:hypothetical protein